MSPPIAFACCVEAGKLEAGTIRLVESLRRWGGALADAPVYAVTPRPGAPLAPETIQRLRELGAEHVHSTPRHRQRWHHYFNKYVALTEAERRSGAAVVTFLDSDLLVVREPSALLLGDDVQFGACAPDKNVGTSGPDDPNEEYWRRLCSAADVDIESLPWLDTHLDDERVRFYWNAGLFTFRTGLGLIEEWRRSMEAGIWAKDPILAEQVWWVDQAMLGLTVARLGLSWTALPYSYNFGVASYIGNTDDADGLAAAHIIHYHDGLEPAHWPRLRERLVVAHPDVVEWLDGDPGRTRPLAGRRKVQAQVYRSARALRRRLWRANGRITLDQLRRGAPDGD